MNSYINNETAFSNRSRKAYSNLANQRHGRILNREGT
jgi:hypothetical protein